MQHSSSIAISDSMYFSLVFEFFRGCVISLQVLHFLQKHIFCIILTTYNKFWTRNNFWTILTSSGLVCKANKDKKTNKTTICKEKWILIRPHLASIKNKDIAPLIKQILKLNNTHKAILKTAISTSLAVKNTLYCIEVFEFLIAFRNYSKNFFWNLWTLLYRLQ